METKNSYSNSLPDREREVLEELKQKVADDVRAGTNRKYVKEGLPDTQAIENLVVDAIESIPRTTVRKRPQPPKIQPIEPNLVTQVDWHSGKPLVPFNAPAAPPPVHPLPLVAERILKLVRDPKYGQRIYEICFYNRPHMPKRTDKEKDELLYAVALESQKEHGPL